VTIAVEDMNGNLVNSDNTSAVTLTLSSGTFANGTTSMTTTVVGGLAVFGGPGLNLIVNKSGSYKLTASDGSLSTATSGIITVKPAAASQLAFQQLPFSGTAGGVISAAVKVAVEDPFGNILTGNSSNVTLHIASGPANFDPASTISMGAVNGVATFNNLVLDTAGKYTLTATDGTLAVPTSKTFTINATTPSQLVLLQAPTSGIAGTAWAPAVKVAVEDRFGNLTATATTVTLSLSNGTFSTGSSTASLVTSGGTATFGNLAITTVGTYVLNAVAGTLPGVSFAISINPAAASKVAFLQGPPATNTAGVAFSPAVTVAVLDKYGNLVVGDNTSSVTLTLSAGTFSNGSKSITAKVVGGLATFSGPGLDLVIKTAGSYKLTASDGTLTTATSGFFSVA
jgi:hypothetical protein